MGFLHITLNHFRTVWQIPIFWKGNERPFPCLSSNKNKVASSLTSCDLSPGKARANHNIQDSVNRRDTIYHSHILARNKNPP